MDKEQVYQLFRWTGIDTLAGRLGHFTLKFGGNQRYVNGYEDLSYVNKRVSRLVQELEINHLAAVVTGGWGMIGKSNAWKLEAWGVVGLGHLHPTGLLDDILEAFDQSSSPGEAAPGKPLNYLEASDRLLAIFKVREVCDLKMPVWMVSRLIGAWQQLPTIENLP